MVNILKGSKCCFNPKTVTPCRKFETRKHRKNLCTTNSALLQNFSVVAIVILCAVNSAYHARLLKCPIYVKVYNNEHVLATTIIN